MLSFYLLASAQIVLESFPVSSSGHIFLLQKLFKKFFEPVEIFFQNKIVDHFLHGPTVLVLIAFFVWSFYPDIVFFLGLSRNQAGREKIFGYRKKVFTFLIFIFVADIVTSLFYVLFKRFWMPPFPLWLGFLWSALALASVGFLKPNPSTPSASSGGGFTFSAALILGAVQGLALFPGISRFGTVFACARWLGFSNRRAFDISFVVQLPLIAAAFFYSFVSKVFFKNADIPDILLQPKSFFIFFCAAVVAFFALLFVRWLLCKNKAWVFSLYLLIPFVLSLLV